MKEQLCVFSGSKIHPGHGVNYVPVISVQSTRPVFHFLNRKTRQHFMRKKNPRDVAWTQMYRKQHKKGRKEEQIKKSRSRKAKKGERSFVGASLETIAAKRNMSAEERKQQREAIVKKQLAKKKKKAKKKLEEKIAEKKQTKEQKPSKGGKKKRS